MALNDKQTKFVDCYLISFNATRAAIEAGYSEATAYAIGNKLLKKAEIVSAIQEVIDEYGMSANETIYHVSQIARTDITDVLDDNGNIDIKKARLYRKTGLIKSIKSRTITTDTSDIIETEVVMHDKLRALEIMAKYHNLTNRVIMEDWRTEIIGLLKEGKIQPIEIQEEFGLDVATELLITAGIFAGESGTE